MESTASGAVKPGPPDPGKSERVLWASSARRFGEGRLAEMIRFPTLRPPVRMGVFGELRIHSPLPNSLIENFATLRDMLAVGRQVRLFSGEHVMTEDEIKTTPVTIELPASLVTAMDASVKARTYASRADFASEAIRERLRVIGGSYVTIYLDSIERSGTKEDEGKTPEDDADVD